MSGLVFTALLHRMSHDANTLQQYILNHEISTVSPVHLAYDVTVRNASRRIIEDSLECMDTDYRSIYELSQKINIIEHTLRQRRAVLRNFLRPVAALPVEVLQRIFLYAIQPNTYFGHEYLPSPVTLSQVCSTWRHAAQSYPPIWTVVRLDPCDHRSYAPYARYSKGLSLELHERNQIYKRERVAGLESPDVQDRIAALSLSLVGEDTWEGSSPHDFWRDRGVFNCESIERLALFATYDVDDRPFYSEALTHLTSLRHLSLENIFMLLSTTQLSNLVTLTLSRVHPDGLMFSDFISACANVQELTLDRSYIWHAHDAVVQVSIPSLHSLSICHLNFAIARFLALYSMPHLQYFSLSVDSSWDNDLDIINDNSYETNDAAYRPANLCTVKDFIIDTPTLKAVALKSGMVALSYVLKRLSPHSSQLEHGNLPGFTDLTVSVWGRVEQPLDNIVDVRLWLKARLEGRQAELVPLQRLTVPRFIIEDDVDWVRSRVRELELTD
ncbi:uncharacterized protein EI90DRAFT_3129086 [Cantharellus anzutake]|uniref:uncharacterized protein n=1 Tax=Cantharellus anzutake TaxID=1750568 RepID=UPI0019061C78|nr:uncharacterized protein EI90DRAFT_3129086 [Cantharellus anzutake]KAF8325257.1 hypothetical protein EI90DRAFT_3129086 [Cantharellus anzutake]